MKIQELLEYKAIITKQNKDGTYDDVGMRNRTLINATSITGIRRKATKLWVGDKKRVEIFHDDQFYKDTPLKIDFLNEDGSIEQPNEMKLFEITQNKGKPTNAEVEKFLNSYERKLTDDDVGVLYNEEFSDRFTDKEVDNQVLDEHITRAAYWYKHKKWPPKNWKWWK